MVRGVNETVAVVLILRHIDLLLILILPHMQKVKSKQLQLPFDQFILLFKQRYLLLQLLHITNLHPLQVKLKYLYPKLHLATLCDLGAAILALADPALEFLDVHLVEEGAAGVLLLGDGVFDADAEVVYGGAGGGAGCTWLGSLRDSGAIICLFFGHGNGIG